MRPEFTRSLPGSDADFLAGLAAALRAPDSRTRGQTYAGGAILRLRDGHERVWSPALHLYLERDEQGVGVLRGRFSPSSPVWTAFVAMYLVIAIAGIGAGCYGGAQMILEEFPWAFWGVPLAALAAGLVYGAAFIGQGLGAADMYELRSFVDRVADGDPPRTN